MVYANFMFLFPLAMLGIQIIIIRWPLSQLDQIKFH